MVQAVQHLVQHVNPPRADLVGRREQGERLASPALVPRSFGRRDVRFVADGQAFGQLALLLQDGAAAGFGRVGGEGRLNVEGLEQPDHVVAAESSSSQGKNGLANRLRPRRPTLALAPAVDPGDLELLGLVPEMEPDREPLEDPLDCLGREAPERSLVPVTGEQPGRGGLDPFLVGRRRQHLVEQPVEPGDVLMQSVGRTEWGGHGRSNLARLKALANSLLCGVDREVSKRAPAGRPAASQVTGCQSTLYGRFTRPSLGGGVRNPIFGAFIADS